jgi:hypothetical protein
LRGERGGLFIASLSQPHYLEARAKRQRERTADQSEPRDADHGQIFSPG